MMQPLSMPKERNRYRRWQSHGPDVLNRPGRMRTTRRPLFGDADPNGDPHPAFRRIQYSRKFLVAERRSRGILR